MTAPRSQPPGEWILRLYIAGKAPKSVMALHNLTKICDEHLAGRYEVEVIDLIERPDLAKRDQIIAIPTLVRELPPPLKKIIGDLSNKQRVLASLELQSAVT